MQDTNNTVSDVKVVLEDIKTKLYMKNLKNHILLAICIVPLLICSCSKENTETKTDTLQDKLQGKWTVQTVSINDGRSWTREELCAMDIREDLGDEYVGWVRDRSFEFIGDKVNSLNCGEPLSDLIDFLEVDNTTFYIGDQLFELISISGNSLNLKYLEGVRGKNPYETILTYNKE